MLHMEKILISRCLVGDNVKYNGGNNLHPLIEKLKEKYDLVIFCPEVEGGLPTPRNPSERIGEKVLMNSGKDVTKNYSDGAHKALAICKYLDINLAILKERSPSCGVKQIYDGTFSNTLIDGQGYTTELLTKNGIKVISEDDINTLL